MTNSETNCPTEPKATSRRIAVILSWMAVAAVAALIFFMSAKDGTTLDTDSGIITMLKDWLASAAAALFGHPVDVSPIGHFAEFFLFGSVLVNALRWHMPLKRAMLAAILLASALFGHPVDVSPIGHFAEFFLFGSVLVNALRWHMPLKRAMLAAILLASAYGITDEIHQIFVPMRSCDPADWAVDTVAALIGALATAGVIRKCRTAEPTQPVV